jgi:hypothetical protein
VAGPLITDDKRHALSNVQKKCWRSPLKKAVGDEHVRVMAAQFTKDPRLPRNPNSFIRGLAREDLWANPLLPSKTNGVGAKREARLGLNSFWYDLCIIDKYQLAVA